jgi:flavin reductase (DIM6/NTAB) family NADH-FMN oxidoreductase RutF
VYVSIRPSRFSNEIIRNTKEFVINLPNEKLVKTVDFCGTKSGRDIDKFESCNLTKRQSNKIKSPYIEECPINLECKVIDIQKYPSHDMFIAEVVATHCDESILDENGNVNLEKANLITFAEKKYWASNKVIGVRGCGVK